jgi:hypothetical protein
MRIYSLFLKKLLENKRKQDKGINNQLVVVKTLLIDQHKIKCHKDI